MKTQSVEELQRQHDKVHDLDMPESDKNDTLEGIEGELVAAEENEERLLSLTTLDGWNKTMIFTDKTTLETLKTEIETAARSIIWDATTEEGRKTGASIARKVSSSKVTADAAGKRMTDEWARQKKEVDAGRKELRDFCDALRDDIRKPIDDWKAAEAAKAEAERLAKEFAADHKEALQRNDLFDREAAVREAEDKIAADKAAEAEAERQAQLEAEQKAREEQAAKDAVEAERQRQIAAEEANKQAEAARKADKEHRREINREALAAIVACGVENEAAVKVVTAIASGLVPHVKIQY